MSGFRSRPGRGFRVGKRRLRKKRNFETIGPKMQYESIFGVLSKTYKKCPTTTTNEFHKSPTNSSPPTTGPALAVLRRLRGRDQRRAASRKDAFLRPQTQASKFGNTRGARCGKLSY